MGLVVAPPVIETHQEITPSDVDNRDGKERADDAPPPQHNDLELEVDGNDPARFSPALSLKV